MILWRNNNHGVHWGDFNNLLRSKEEIVKYHEGFGKFKPKRDGADFINEFKIKSIINGKVVMSEIPWEYSRVGIVVKEENKFQLKLNWFRLKWYTFYRGFWHTGTVFYKFHSWLQDHSDLYLKWDYRRRYGKNLGNVLYWGIKSRK